jgi:hypothetical protein
MHQDDILIRRTTGFQAIANRILALSPADNYGTDFVQMVTLDKFAAAERHILFRNDQVNCRDLGQGGKTHQGADQDRLTTQLEVLFAGVTVQPAAAACRRDQSVNIHNLSCHLL